MRGSHLALLKPAVQHEGVPLDLLAQARHAGVHHDLLKLAARHAGVHLELLELEARHAEVRLDLLELAAAAARVPSARNPTGHPLVITNVPSRDAHRA